MEYTWKVKTGRFQSGSSLYLNKICVASYEWNVMQSQSERHDNNDWSGEVALPGLKNPTMIAGSEKEIKGRIERIVSFWFKEALAKAEG